MAVSTEVPESLSPERAAPMPKVLEKLAEICRLLGASAVLLVPMDAAGRVDLERMSSVRANNDPWPVRTLARFGYLGSEAACAVCGCTQEDACVTDGVPCGWVKNTFPYLCTACVETETGKKLLGEVATGG